MRKDILKQFNNTIFITKEMLRDISKDNEENISKNLLRWKKSGDIIKLKNGTYITKDTYNKYKHTEGFTELIANKLRTPSYISLEYALSKYQIIPEAIYTTTSISLKTKREFNTSIGKYTYKSIKKSLFLGYKIEKFLNHDYYIATKEKALFDYIYFKKDTLPTNLDNINLIEELRLNLETFTKKDLKTLKKYSNISKDEKVINIIENIIKNASNYI